ncbi:MAG: NUDIX domain-containing protein [Patescibacteria group bacterium]
MKTNHSIAKNPELITRAIIIHRGKILLCTGIGTKRYFLPGGHIEMFETCDDALKREIKEELGISVKKQTLVGMVENFYYDGKKNRHEINMVYLVKPSKYEIRSQEDHLEFHWIPVAKTQKVSALPKPLFKVITAWVKNKKFFVITVDGR